MKINQKLVLSLCLFCAAAASSTCAQIIGIDNEYIDKDNGEGGAGGGGSTPCALGSSRPCYSGPLGTQGVGVCQAGTQTCAPNGEGYGPCTGEVTPSFESCLNKTDDDCDGTVNDGCPCNPGDTMPCYSGPMGTENVGPCKAGVQTCAIDGSGFGACMNEILPVAEDCSTPQDDDCDGSAYDPLDTDCLCAPGTMTSCKTGALGACGNGMGLCQSDGQSVGPCSQTAMPSFEDCATAADEDCDGKADPCTGAAVDGYKISAAQDDVFFAVATDSANNRIMGGVFNGTVSDYTVNEGQIVLAKVDPAGSALFSTSYSPGAGNHAVIRGIATDPTDNIVTTGELRGTIAFGGANLASSGTMNPDMFIAKFDPNGNYMWGKRFGDNLSQAGVTVAVDKNSRIYVTGYMSGSMDFNIMPLTSAGGQDVFVARFSSAGAVAWSKNFGDAADQQGIGIVVTPDGNIVVAGPFKGTINFGAAMTSAGDSDIFVAKLSATDGSMIWAKSFGDAKFQTVYSLAVDAAGDLALTGGFKGTVNFGGADLKNSDPLNSTQDIYVAKLSSADGSHIWSKSFGDFNDQTPAAVAEDTAGNVTITGYFQGNLNFGGANLFNAGGINSDIFVAKFASATGDHLWSASYGDFDDQRAWAIATDRLGNEIIGGGFRSSLNLGGQAGTLNAQGGYDAFSAKFMP